MITMTGYNIDLGQFDQAELAEWIQEKLNAGIIWMGQGILGHRAEEMYADGIITVPEHKCEDNIIHGEIATYCKVCGYRP